ncbi:MAG TPA: hypothetical protein VJ249_01930 [Candidatus Bathyarchaeia archaeon]|nr:hypothetical protein [Candidatus Bathyarchaeia archaeon]
MEVSKVKQKLFRLPGASVFFNKVSAVLQTTKASVLGVQAQTDDSDSYAAMMSCRARQLEVDLLRAEAEEYARRTRQRLV